MERKIGEIFELKGEWYQCAEGTGCYKCDFNFNEDTCVAENPSERMFQKYRTYEKNFFLNERDLLFTSYGDIVSIEIKQKQEDMEEKKLNLKPFDLKKAKEGKPVCTRDGRKTRILCYDFKQNEEYPILVAVENKDGKECALLYSNDGVSEMYKSSNNELAMLPEKKEGWVNVYKERCYETKEEAIEATYDGVTYVDTVKVCWEE